MIEIRDPKSIFQVDGDIRNGTFHGRWHFSFGQYYDPEHMGFGTLRVFNDDTLSPGSVWPLHQHKEIEVVTYCAGGEFRHEDEKGKGGVLKKGWVQHTTVGTGMMHSEINDRPDEPMRFIQMWFIPSEPGHVPSVEQKAVDRYERTNRFLPLVSDDRTGALHINSKASVMSCFLEKKMRVGYTLDEGHGAYLYVVEGGPVHLDEHELLEHSAAAITDEYGIALTAGADTELLLVDVVMGNYVRET